VELCGESEGHEDADSNSNSTGNPLYKGPSSGVQKFALADVQLARESDLGKNDEVLSCVTHLGHLIKPGDVVLGYDLVTTSSSLNTTVHKAGSTKKGSSFMGAASVVGLDEVLNSNVVLQDVVLVKKISAKEQKQRELAEDLATKQADHDHDIHIDNNTKDSSSKPAGKISKKKLRRQQKRDKKQRELEESAARMGFMDDLAESQAAREEIHKANDILDDNVNDHDETAFAKKLEDDPELAAEMRAVERELAEAYPKKIPEEDETKNCGEDSGGGHESFLDSES